MESLGARAGLAERGRPNFWYGMGPKWGLAKTSPVQVVGAEFLVGLQVWLFPEHVAMQQVAPEMPATEGLPAPRNPLCT